MHVVFERNSVYYHRALNLYFSNFYVSYWNAASHYRVCLHLGKCSIWLCWKLTAVQFKLDCATKNPNQTELQEHADW